MSARKLSMTSVWEENRHLDESHVAALHATADPRSLQGPYGIVTYRATDADTDSNLLIDGQHRQAVLKRYFEANPIADDFQVLCRRYFPADHIAAVEIFKTINTAKPMVYAGSSTERLHQIQRALQSAFIHTGSKPVVLIRENCNRPCLNTAHLASALKLYGLHERHDLPIAAIIAHAEKMNVWYAEDQNRCPVQVTRTIMDKAREYNFYLGLDPRCMWLMGLKN
jgi:hypothetical protein